MTERPYRIMIVEDSETQALMLRYTLEKEGWEVSAAATAEEALEALNRGLPDLMVVDYHLPGIQGDELCRRLRMNVNTRGVPILMLTAEETDAAEMRGLESGADDYIAKSADPDILMLRVHALLRQSRAQGAILGPGDAYFHRARLLLIDDSLTYLEYLRGELEKEGYEVERATGGAGGLSRAASGAFDCILVDLVMPEMDGIEVCRRLTEMRRTMDNPIVVMMLTARETKEDMTRGLEAGADDFVGKSSDMAVLRARIRALLRRKFFQEENLRIIRELREQERALQAEVAERRRAEEALRAKDVEVRGMTQQLWQSAKLATMGELAASIAHELNNPLATVSLRVESLLADLSEEDPNRRALGVIEGEVERMGKLVANLLQFSRRTGQQISSVDVREEVRNTLELIHYHLRNRRIAVVQEFAPDAPVIQADRQQLRQLFLNLFTNASDAMPEGGALTIRVNAVGATRHPTCRCNDSRPLPWSPLQVVIEVADTGAGIAPEHLSRVMEPFFTTKEEGKGTGLGLAICRRIAQEHHGTLEIESEAGKGTTVRIALPVRNGSNARALMEG